MGPIARLYRNDTGLCWQASYSASSGYGAWVETSTGPLNTSCATVSSATWYVRANSMNSGATYTGTGSISSGYMGFIHMVHQPGSGVVVGGEMDGRTLSEELAKGKPAHGEVYVVSTSNAQETLVASTEASAQSQLLSPSAVEAGSVGGLTGTSAQTLQSQLGTFTSVWSHSASVSMAEEHGLVSQRCPSNTSAAYIAIGPEKRAFTSQQTSSLQRLNNTDLQLLLVTKRHSPADNR